jgi:hypothetical protein
MWPSDSQTRWSRAGTLSVTLLLLIAVACSYAFLYKRSAPCGDVTLERIESALHAESSFAAVSREPWNGDVNLKPYRIVLDVTCSVGSERVRVEVQEPPRTVVLRVLAGSRPSPERRASMIAAADRVAGVLVEACPEIGAWTVDDETASDALGRFVLLYLAAVGVVVALLVWIGRARRRPSGEVPSSNAPPEVRG